MSCARFCCAFSDDADDESIASSAASGPKGSGSGDDGSTSDGGSDGAESDDDAGGDFDEEAHASLMALVADGAGEGRGRGPRGRRAGGAPAPVAPTVAEGEYAVTGAPGGGAGARAAGGGSGLTLDTLVGCGGLGAAALRCWHGVCDCEGTAVRSSLAASTQYNSLKRKLGALQDGNGPLSGVSVRVRLCKCFSP